MMLPQLLEFSKSDKKGLEIGAETLYSISNRIEIVHLHKGGK